MTSGGPRTPEDRLRLNVAAVLANHVEADDHLRIALMRFAQGARTHADGEIMREMAAAREAIAQAHTAVLQLHRNRRTDE